MVPVQMTEKNRAVEGPIAEQRAEPADARTGIKNERGNGIVVVFNRHARREAAVAHELAARRGRRAADAQEVDSHRVSPRPYLPDGVPWTVPRVSCDQATPRAPRPREHW